MLKLGVPTGDSLREEAPALRAFAGEGAVRALRADLDRGALLLERAEPGERLRDLVPARDAEATSIAAAVMQRLATAEPARPACPTWSTRPRRSTSTSPGTVTVARCPATSWPGPAG